jgi:hypothetical protein
MKLYAFANYFSCSVFSIVVTGTVIENENEIHPSANNLLLFVASVETLDSSH